MTQGTSLEDLKEYLLDLYHDLSMIVVVPPLVDESMVMTPQKLPVARVIETPPNLVPLPR